MRRRINLNLKKKFGAGIFIIVLAGIVQWIFVTFFAGIDEILRTGVLHFVPYLGSALENNQGAGLLVLPFIALALGTLASIKPAQKTIKYIVIRIPLVGKWTDAIMTTLAGLKSLPLVEVAYPSPKYHVRGWLRSVRWAERPTANGETEKFIECTVALPTMNNPTSGWGVTVDPTEILFVLSNPSVDFLVHVLSFTLYNPTWKREKIFNPLEYLDQEFLPEGAQDRFSRSRTKTSD